MSPKTTNRASSPSGADARKPLPLDGRHLADVPVLLELLCEGPVRVEERSSDEGEPDERDEPAARRVVEHACRGGTLLDAGAPAAARSVEKLERCDGQGDVDDGATGVPGPLRESGRVRAFPVAVEDRLHEPPQGVGDEAERERDEERLPVDALLRELLEGTFAALRLACARERERRGEDTHEPVRETLGDEAEACKSFHPRAVGGFARCLLRAVQRFLDAHAGQVPRTGPDPTLLRRRSSVRPCASGRTRGRRP